MTSSCSKTSANFEELLAAQVDSILLYVLRLARVWLGHDFRSSRTRVVYRLCPAC